MEVTLAHPDSKEKVVVTNQIQYDAFKARGFVDVAEKENKDKEAAETPALKAHPMADASDAPHDDKDAEDTPDTPRKSTQTNKSVTTKKETK